MGQYWTRKNDQEDQDSQKTADPWAEHKIKGDRNFPEKKLTEYEKYCSMMAQQQEDDMDELIQEDALCSSECFQQNDLKEYQPEGVFVRSH